MKCAEISADVLGDVGDVAVCFVVGETFEKKHHQSRVCSSDLQQEGPYILLLLWPMLDLSFSPPLKQKPAEHTPAPGGSRRGTGLNRIFNLIMRLGRCWN